MNALKRMSLAIWMLFGIVNILLGIVLIRATILFVAWLREPEKPFELIKAAGGWC
jgi:hypothetical protein